MHKIYQKICRKRAGHCIAALRGLAKRVEILLHEGYIDEKKDARKNKGSKIYGHS